MQYVQETPLVGPAPVCKTEEGDDEGVDFYLGCMESILVRITKRKQIAKFSGTYLAGCPMPVQAATRLGCDSCGWRLSTFALGCSCQRRADLVHHLLEDRALHEF